MSSTAFLSGLAVLLCLTLTALPAASAATPVGKVLKKMREDARREEAGEPPAKPAAEPAKKRPVKVTISKETTYITSPLRPDGYPDYVAALDVMAAKGVAPENNAVVLLVQAFGPKEIKKEYREQYFQKLGIPPLPEIGEYFVDYAVYYDQLRRRAERDASRPPDHEDVFNQYERALEKPWSEKDCPLVAEWLQANEKPLKLMVEALQRPRYHRPLSLGSGVSLMGLGHGSDISRMREIIRIFHIRAMRLLQQGKAMEAWREVATAQRLASLVAQSPTLLDLLVANGIRRMAFSAQRAVLHSGSFTPAHLRSLQAELRKLPPLPGIADRVDTAERFICLDAACTAARKGYTSWQFLDEKETYKEPPVDALRNWVVSGHIDWNEVVRKVNNFADRLVAAGRKPVFRDRSAALAELSDELGELDKKTSARSPRLLKGIAADVARLQDTEQVAAWLIVMFMWSNPQLMLWDYQTPTQMQLTDLALTLALYRAEQGAYPDRLEQLVPKYLAEVPKDCYSGAAIRYKREGTGYLLYSLGPNGKDDGGRGRFMDPPPGEDEEVDEAADDIGFHVPALAH